MSDKKVTIEAVQFLVEHWTTMTRQELADHFDVNLPTISRWAHYARKSGIDLPRKKRTETSVFKEVADRLPAAGSGDHDPHDIVHA
jgi:transposase